jgi:hypothetical protein
MALVCWATGWLASLTWSWEPILIAAAAAFLFVTGEALKRPRHPLLPLALVLLVPAAGLAWFLRVAPDEDWAIALVMPSILYAGVIVARLERLPASRLLAVAAMTALAPVSYGLASGGFGAPAALLWLSLGGYFLLGSLFVMARLRRSAGMLWGVRASTTASALAAMLCPSEGVGHWLLAIVFLVLAVRTWVYQPRGPKLNPRRVGLRELGWSLATLALVLAAVWSW